MACLLGRWSIEHRPSSCRAIPYPSYPVFSCLLPHLICTFPADFCCSYCCRSELLRHLNSGFIPLRSPNEVLCQAGPTGIGGVSVQATSAADLQAEIAGFTLLSPYSISGIGNSELAKEEKSIRSFSSFSSIPLPLCLDQGLWLPSAPVLARPVSPIWPLAPDRAP